MGILYDPESVRFPVALSTTAASSKPMVMASWYAPTIVPRIHLGAVSDWYSGIKALIIPTPKPAKNRPATNMGISVAAVWRMTPKVNTMVDTIRPRRRPKKSPAGAAVRAPKKVPAESSETISEDCEAVMAGFPVWGSV